MYFGESDNASGVRRSSHCVINSVNHRRWGALSVTLSDGEKRFNRCSFLELQDDVRTTGGRLPVDIEGHRARFVNNNLRKTNFYGCFDRCPAGPRLFVVCTLNYLASLQRFTLSGQRQ